MQEARRILCICHYVTMNLLGSYREERCELLKGKVQETPLLDMPAGFVKLSFDILEYGSLIFNKLLTLKNAKADSYKGCSLFIVTVFSYFCAP